MTSEKTTLSTLPFSTPSFRESVISLFRSPGPPGHHRFLKSTVAANFSEAFILPSLTISEVEVPIKLPILMHTIVCKKSRQLHTARIGRQASGTAKNGQKRPEKLVHRLSVVCIFVRFFDQNEKRPRLVFYANSP